VLAVAPTLAKAARLTKPQILAALRRAGRQRGLTTYTAALQQRLRSPQLRHPTPVEDTFGVQALALLATLDTECANLARLGHATAAVFAQHPDYRIITSFVGAADMTGARLLAEIGDDKTRFADARGLKAFAGSAPVTKASGRKIRITHRHVKNNRLAPVGFVGPSSPPVAKAPPATTTSPAASAATGTPQPCVTCSTGCSASSTTACKPARPTTRPKPTGHHRASKNRPPLDS
jgi:Transposase IS116/IS110/IS902 family